MLKKIIVVILFLSVLVYAAPKAPELYGQAYAEYRQKNLESAETMFLDFVKQYPDGFYTGNGYYWLGRIYFQQKKYYDAAVQFEKVTLCKNIYKHSDAMMRLGRCYVKLQDYYRAKSEFERIINRYADSGNEDLIKEARNRIRSAEAKLKKLNDEK